MYIVCHTKCDMYGCVSSHVQKFDDFEQAVAMYTLVCGWHPPSVVLADTETKQILKQYSHTSVGRDTIV